MDLDEIYKALRSEYDGKTWGDEFLRIHITLMRDGQIICWFNLDEDDEGFEEKRDSTISFYDEVVRFLVDRFGEEFKYEDPRISADYIDRNNMYGQYDIVLDDDGENAPVIAIWENEGAEVKSRFNESTEDARHALARELGVSIRNVRASETDEYDYYEPDYTLEVQGKDGSLAVYLVYDNEESAKTSAADDLGERFEDDPPILGAAIDYFGFPIFKEFVNGLDEGDLEELESLKDDLQNEEFAEYVQGNIGVDYRGFAEYNIEQLGPAWHIATYDGKELELPNGMLAYRID